MHVQFSSVAQSCPTLCDSMNRSTPGLPVHHQLQLTQIHMHQVSDAIYLGPHYGGGNEDNDVLPRKIPCMYCHTQCPLPCSKPPLTPASARDSQTPTGQSPVGPLFLSPGSWCTRFCCALRGSISYTPLLPKIPAKLPK